MRSRLARLSLFPLLLVIVLSPQSARVTARAASPVSLSVDATATGEPISKYVYGQFIEHLGRCIYGGLWAEMLEDRKFYYPVTGDAPAWEMFTPSAAIVGRRGQAVRTARALALDGRSATRAAVTMVKEGAYVGEHSAARRAGRWRQGRGPLPGAPRPAAGPRVRRPDRAGWRRRRLARSKCGWPGAAGRASGRSSRCPLTGSGFATTTLRFRSGGTTDNGRLEIVGKRHGSVHGRHRVADARGQRPRMACGHAGATCASSTRRSTAGPAATSCQRLRLEGRHRRPRQAPAPQEPGVEGHRAQRRRPRRVHAAVPRDRDRAVRRGEHRPWRRRGRRGVGAVRQRRRRHADGQAAGAARQPPARST